VVGTLQYRCAQSCSYIDVCILEEDSHRQNKMIMRNEVLRAQNIETFGANYVCFLEQLRHVLRTWTFVTYNSIGRYWCVWVDRLTQSIEIANGELMQKTCGLLT
jgi:hypothetical protein